MILERPQSDSLRLKALAFAAPVFVGYAIITCTTGAAMGLLLTYIFFYLLGFFAYSVRWIWLTYCGFMVVNVAIAIAYHYDPSLPYLNGTFGLWGNPNWFGCAVTLALAGAIAYSYWWYLPAAVIGLWLSHSRGAILGAGVISAIAIWRWSKFAGFCFAMIGIAMMLSLIHGDGKDDIWARVGIWQDTINHLTIFGHGWGSYFDSYRMFPIHTNMTGIVTAHAYNDALELIFELGIFAIPLWIIVVCSMETADRGSMLIIIAFGVMSLTFFPLYIPILGQLFALQLGHAANHGRIRYGSLETDRPALS